MFMITDKLKVALVSDHIPLNAITTYLTPETIEKNPVYFCEAAADQKDNSGTVVEKALFDFIAMDEMNLLFTDGVGFRKPSYAAAMYFMHIGNNGGSQIIALSATLTTNMVSLLQTKFRINGDSTFEEKDISQFDIIVN